MAVNDLEADDRKATQSNLTLGFLTLRLTSFRLMRNGKASQKRKLLSG